MAITTFKLENLAAIGGGAVAKQFDKLIARAIADCRERPADSKARKVGLSMSVKPVSDPDVGGCDEVEIEFDLSIATPKLTSRIFSIGLKANGTPYFNGENDGPIHQRTLDEMNGRQLPPDEPMDNDEE